MSVLAPAQVPDFHGGSIYAISWQSRGRLLATGSNDKMVQLTRVSQSDSGMVSHTSPLVLQGTRTPHACMQSVQCGVRVECACKCVGMGVTNSPNIQDIPVRCAR